MNYPGPANTPRSCAICDRCENWSAPGLNDLADLGVDLAFPTASAEHAVMADAALQMMRLHVDPHAGAKVERRHGLADGTDVVLFALHGQQSSPADRGGRHSGAVEGQLAKRQMVV